MDKECQKLLENLSNKEYRLFLQNAIGLLSFRTMNHHNFSMLSQAKKKLQDNDKKKIFAYAYIANDLIDYYYYYKKDDLSFFNKNEERFDTTTYFDALGNDIIYLLLLNSKDAKEYSSILKREFVSLSSTIRNDLFSYCFILGTGVDLPNEDSKGFPVKNWGALIDELENSIISETGLSKADIKDIKGKIGNTDYVSPQISKDVNRDVYFQTIYDCLYSGFTPDMIDNSCNRDLKNETLYCIAEVLAAQSTIQTFQRVLTFNYDNFLEQILEQNFKISPISSFKSSSEKNGGCIEIIHSHGFLPFEGLLSKNKNSYQESVVLSSFEYMDMYEDSNSYSYSKLYNQLHSTNLIIGNSMVDYEEEKVFRNHHKRYLSEYSYILMKKSNASYKWLDAYRLMLFLQMGVLPIFFDNYSDIRDFVKSLLPSW